METKSFEMEYRSYNDEEYDVSLDMNGEFEEALFAELYLSGFDEARVGDPPTRRLYLLDRLSAQKSDHEARSSADSKRVYELTIDFTEYSILSNVIGNIVSARMNVYDMGVVVNAFRCWYRMSEQIIEQDDEYDRSMLPV